MAFVTLTSFRDPIDAELAKVKLESADIPAVVGDQALVSIYWLYSRAIGGVKVRVDEADLDRAREVLREDRSADLLGVRELEASADEADRCSACGSTRIRRSNLQRNVAALGLATGLPVFAWRRRSICMSCGHSWRYHRGSTADVPSETLEAEQRVYERRDYSSVQVVIAFLTASAIVYHAIRAIL